MASDSYRSGYERGEVVASCSRKEIVEADTSALLGKLAGKKLRIASQVPSDWLMNYEDWKVGFWDGFMKKSEEMMLKRRET